MESCLSKGAVLFYRTPLHDPVVYKCNKNAQGWSDL